MAARKPARSKKKAPSKRPPRLVGIRQLARELGVTHTAVQRAIEDGRIARAVVSEPAGRGRPWQIDSARAKRLWKARTNTSHRPPAELKERAKKATLPEEPVDRAAPQQETLPLETAGGDLYEDSRARREAANARLKEMEADRVEGSLIDSRKTASAVQAAFAMMREALQSFGPNVSDDLIGMEDQEEIERYLYFKIEKLLQEAADGIAHLADHPDSRRGGAAA